MTNKEMSRRIPTKINILGNFTIARVVKSVSNWVDNYITPATSEEFISSNYTEEKQKSLISHYKMYNACTDKALKLAAIQNMAKDGFRVEALDLFDRNHS